MSTGLYSGVSGLSLGVGLYAGNPGLWGGAAGLNAGLPAALYLNFLSGVLDNRITFTRSTTATFVGSNGLIQSSAINEPRFDYDPATLAAKGLLIEEQRTNLVLRSEEFDNAVWTKVRTTISANATASPDGTVSADKLVENTDTNTHLIQLQDSFTAAVSGTSYTVSGYAKIGERTSSSIQMGSDGGVFADQSATFNFSTGVISAQFGTATFAMVDAGNGWYRWSITATAAASGAPFIRFKIIGPNGSTTYTGDGTSGLFIWGAQLEVGAFATSYIPTVASTVTRSADNALMSGTNFSSWFNQSAGAFVAVYDSVALTAFGILGNNSSGYLLAASTRDVKTYNGTTSVATSNTLSAGAVGSGALSYDSTGRSVVLNGGTVVTAAGVLQTINTLYIGYDAAFSANYLNGHIRTIAYYNTRLSNAQLQALTA